MKILAASSALAAIIAVGTAFAADHTIGPDQVRANKIIGTSVYDRDNEDVASVKDIILDKSGRVAEVVLSYGTTAGLGGKYVAVPFRSLKFDHDRLTLDQSKAQLDQMASYNLEDSNTGGGEGPVPAEGGHAN